MPRRTIGRRAAEFLREWSVPRQARGEDHRTEAAESATARGKRPRTELADRVGTSICPYCAVGCSQLVYAKNGQLLHIEGDPRSPINQGTLCPKGAATFGLLTSPERISKVKYRAPYSDHWEEVPQSWAMERITAISWVMSRIVRPSSRLMRARSSRIDRVVSGSRAEVASSESSTLGFVASARAMPTRCFWPPDSSAG